MSIGVDTDDENTGRSITTRAQREIFLIEQTRPDTRCNIWFYKLINGALDLKVLAIAIKQLTSEVPLLQTQFYYSDGELYQIQNPTVQYNPKTIDVTAYPSPLEEALSRMRKAANQAGLITDNNSLCNFTFYIIGTNKYILYVQFHHGIIDVRSWSKLESLLTTAYNDLKQGKEITVRPELHFDALARIDAAYQASVEHDEDKKFWQDYVQPLKRFAYTQRSINFVGKKTAYRHTMTLANNERQKLQQTAATMDISESFLYIGISALLFRSLLGHEYVSLSLPVRGTYFTQELGMTSNVLPLLLKIPEDATIHDVLLQISQETKLILQHQRYRVEDILKLADYSSSASFGPSVNIMRYDHGTALDGCRSSSHFGANIDINDLQITFWTDDRNGRLDILFDDVSEGHSEEQLVALQHHLAFILDRIICAPNSTIATLDEECREVATVNLNESFYANRRRPIGAGFLQWTQNCDSLVRLVNSNTWVGNEASPFAISKVLLNDRAVRIKKLERISNSIRTKTPGIVVAIDETGWHVTAADGVVKIKDFSNEFGQPISAQSLAEQCHIIEGALLPIITPQQAQSLSAAYAQAMPAEIYWSKHLTSFEPCQPSFVQSTVNQSPSWAATAYHSSGGFSAIEVLTAWLIYIARDTQKSGIQIGWDASQCWYQVSEPLSTFLFAKTVPFATSICLDDAFCDVLVTVEKDYKQLVNYPLCLSDTFIRYTSVAINSDGRKPWTLAVSLIDTQNEFDDRSDAACERASHGDLMTLLIDKQNGAFRWVYDTSRISEEELDRISNRLCILLASTRSDDASQKPVAKLNLLPEDERDLLLNIWNQTAATNPPAQFVHQLFESQVECDGQAIAVEYNGETLSYAELNAQANRLAHYLIARGVKPDDRIALCVERSTAMIMAMLGILKASGAYVPLDPVYSSQRLTHILKDVDPIFVVADSNGRKALGKHQIPVIDLSECFFDDLPTANPDATEIGLTPTALAYVIYTSGSTGTPKGVMVEHNHVTQLVSSVHEKLNTTKRDKWSLFSSFAFDCSVFEIWGAICYGSQLSIVPYSITRSVDEFYDWICTNKITVLTLTPSAFKMLILAKDTTLRRDRLRYVNFGGEALDPSIVIGWKEHNNEIRTVLTNGYGPTETVVNATFWMDDNTLCETLPVIPIGRPLSNKRVYLLDSYGEPVPLGAEGELYVGGDGLARGYLNRPDLTAQRFLPDPFSDNPSARMYRTGDRARYLPDGNLVYLGRSDQQVKIRGFRIELGEIEAHLLALPQVREAVVQPHENRSDVRLIAYVVAEPSGLLAQNLRNYLLKLLPDYMVPAAYVCLPSLPLTPNGKLNRQALPAPDDAAFALHRYEAPRNEIEKIVADIWQDLLGINRISRNDNFFELGGHSLLVMHFVNKAKLCNLHIDARGIYSYPMLKEFTKQLKKRTNRMYCDVAIPIRQSGNEEPLFLLPGGRGDISHTFELAREIDKDIPVYVLPWTSPENIQPSSIEEMANGMICLMKRVRANGPYSIAGYSGGGILAYEMAKQLINSGHTVSFLGLFDTYPPLPDFLTETETLLSDLLLEYPVFKTIDDLNWWARVHKLALNEAIEEIRNANIDLKNIDLEWEALLSKQRHNYRKMCASIKLDSLPIVTHLFKAANYHLLFPLAEHMDHVSEEDNNDDNFKICFNSAKLGWEKYNLSSNFHVVSVNGDHYSMMKDQKNRALLGKKITKFLNLRTHNEMKLKLKLQR